MSRRVRENILEPTIADNSFNEDASNKLEALRQELLDAANVKLRYIEVCCVLTLYNLMHMITMFSAKIDALPGFARRMVAQTCKHGRRFWSRMWIRTLG